MKTRITLTIHTERDPAAIAAAIAAMLADGDGLDWHALPPADRDEHAGRIRCPACGNADPTLLVLVEDRDVWWPVRGLEPAAPALILDAGRRGDGEDFGNARLECHAPVACRLEPASAGRHPEPMTCGAVFLPPPEVELDWS